MDDIKDKIDLITRIKKEFEADKKAAEKRNKRMKRDLRAASGSIDDQFSKEDDDIRGKDRARIAIPVLDGYIRKMVSQYIANPYGINATPLSNDGELSQLIERLNYDIQRCEHRSSAKHEYADALYMTGSCGYGYLYVTTDIYNGNTEPFICAVDDSRMVTFDRNSKRLDGSDAKRAAYSYVMSVKEASEMYGDDVKNGYGVDGFLSDGSRARDEDNCPIVICWEIRKESGTCWVIKIAGNKVIEEVDTKCPHLLIVPVYGMKNLVGDAMEYVGMIHKSIGIQQMINFCASKFQEDLATAPATKWKVAEESMDDMMIKTISESHRSLHPAILYKAFDRTGKPIPSPERLDPSNNSGYLTSSINDLIGFASASIGIQPSGIGDYQKKNETAEAVLLRAKESESSIADIYSHLEPSMCQLGRVLSHMIKACHPDIYGTVDLSMVDFEIDAGPMLSTKRKDNLRSTLALMGMMENPEEKKMLYGDLVANADGVGEGAEAAFTAISQKAIALSSSPVGADAGQMEALQVQLSKITEQLNQANIYAQNLQQQNYALSMGEQSKITVAQIKAETDRYVAEIKLAAGNEIKMQEINASYNQTMLKLNAEFEREMAKRPDINIVEGVTPQYRAVGNMQSNLLR